MVKVVYIKNPFSPADGRMTSLYDVENKPVNYYIGDFVNSLPNNEAWVEIDGRRINCNIETEYNQLVKPSSFIIVMPKVQKGGKKILGLVATIALSVAAMGVGNLVAGNEFFMTAAKAVAKGITYNALGFWSYAAMATVMFLGGSLINKMMMPKIDQGRTEDPTYSWNGIQTMENQGNGIAITYGTIKSGGQSIAKFTSNNGDDQYFNWLVSAGEGELEISDIQLNDNAIANYEDCTLEIRSGTNDQAIIPNFNDTIQSKALGYEINDNTWRTDIVDGNAAQGLIIEVEASQGLYHAKDDGKLSKAWVDLRAEYSLDGNTWNTFPTTRFEGAKAGTVRKQYRIDNLPQGKYQVRIMVTGRSAGVDSTRDGVRVWWSQLSTIVYDDFCYPNIALIGMKLKATSQLSGGTPKLTFIKTRPNVWVWNPNTNVYESRPSDNPAWACYDFLHGCQRLKNIHTNEFEFEARGVPQKLIMYEQFLEWAESCEKLDLKINIEITSLKDFWTILNQDIAPIGRGMVVQFGTKFGCIFDRVQEPVQLFNDSNIIQGSFSLAYLGKEDRADSVEITFTNKDKNYERDTLTIHSDNYDQIDIPNPTQISMDGITDYKQAFREGKYQLKCNQLLQQTVSFKADIEAIACMVGDMILVSHSVPQWGINGRILKVFDQRRFIIPIDEMEIEENARYSIMVRKNADNSILTYNIENITEKFGEMLIVMNGAPSVNVGDIFYIGKRTEGVEDTEWYVQGEILRVVDKNSIIAPVDIEVDINAEYYIIVKNQYDDSIAMYNINELTYKFGEALVILPESANIEVDDIFTIGKINSVGKPFIVKSITRSSEQERTISALEYAEGVFEENYDIPTINYSLLTEQEAQSVNDLTAEQITYVSNDGIQRSKMFISWRMPDNGKADSFIVYLSTDDGQTFKQELTTTTLNAEIDTQPLTGYFIKVVTLYGMKVSEAAIIGRIESGIDRIPPDVKNFTHRLLADGTRLLWWDFDYPYPNDIAGFQIRWSVEDNATWDNARPLHNGVLTSQPFETQIVTPQAASVLIKAVDNAGQMSANPAKLIIGASETIKDNILWEMDLAENNWNGVTHNGYVSNNGELHANETVANWTEPNETYWSNPRDPKWDTNYNTITVDAVITAPVSGRFWIEFDANTQCWLEYKINDDGFRPNVQKAEIRAGDKITVHAESNGTTTMAIIKAIKLFVDVPDLSHHFEDIKISTAGTVLPIKYRNYYTVSVRVDSSSEILIAEVIERYPCKVKLKTMSGDYVSSTVDLTWQGYIKELI